MQVMQVNVLEGEFLGNVYDQMWILQGKDDIPEQAGLHYRSLTISGSKCVLVLSEN